MVINHSGSPTGSKWRDATIQFVEESFSNKVRPPKYLQVRRGTGRSEKKESLLASSATIQLRKDVLIDCMARLRKSGFKIESPIQLSKKHIESIVDSWIADELTVKTVQNRMSVLRCWPAKSKTAKAGPSLGFMGFLHNFWIEKGSISKSVWLNLLSVEAAHSYLNKEIGSAPWVTRPSGEDCQAARDLKASYIGTDRL